MNTGWKCPSCGSCYSPTINECGACNLISNSMRTTTSSTVYIPHKQCKCNTDKHESCSECEILEKQNLQILCD